MAGKRRIDRRARQNAQGEDTMPLGATDDALLAHRVDERNKRSTWCTPPARTSVCYWEIINLPDQRAGSMTIIFSRNPT